MSSPTRSAAAMERSRERGSLRGASEKVFAVEEFVGCDFHRVAGLGAERGCIESDEISRRNETKSQVWEYARRFGEGVRGGRIRGV